MCIYRHIKAVGTKAGENWENVCPLKSPFPPVTLILFTDTCFLHLILCKQNFTMKLLTRSLTINPSYTEIGEKAMQKAILEKKLTTYFWVPGDV